MTLSTVTAPTSQVIESIADSTQSGFPAATSAHSPLHSMVDIHRALNEVRQMREFQPPQPGFLDELLKQPLVKEIGNKLNQLITQALLSLKQLLSQIRPTGLSHLPENIRDIVSLFIGFLLVLMGLYAVYILLGWLLRLREKKALKSAAEARHFEEALLIDSNYHYQKAQEAAQIQEFEDALRQLYMATLCLLDEQKVVPYTATRSNLEYLQSLEQANLAMEEGEVTSNQQLKQSFLELARRFEAARYGNQPVNEVQFEQSQASYKQMQELTVPHG